MDFRSIVTVLSLGLVAACATPKPAAKAGHVEPAASSPLDVLPADTVAAVGIDVRHVMRSKLWATYGQRLLRHPEVQAVALAAEGACAIDPTTDVESIVIGFGPDGDSDRGVILVKGAFDEPELSACLNGIAAKNGDTITARTEGRITEYRTKGQDVMYVGWAAPGLAVFVPRALAGDRAALEAVLSAKAHARDNRTFAAALAETEPSGVLWVAVRGEGQLGAQLAGFNPEGPPPSALWLDVGYERALSVELGLRFPDEQTAADMVSRMGPAIDAARADPQLGPYLASLTATVRGADARFTLAMTEAESDDLIAEIIDLLPFLLTGLIGGAAK